MDFVPQRLPVGIESLSSLGHALQPARGDTPMQPAFPTGGRRAPVESRTADSIRCEEFLFVLSTAGQSSPRSQLLHLLEAAVGETADFAGPDFSTIPEVVYGLKAKAASQTDFTPSCPASFEPVFQISRIDKTGVVPSG